MIKAIILDIDGVLLESTKIIVKTHQKLAKKLGLRVPRPREFSKLWGRPLEEIVKIIWPDVDLNKYVKNYRKTLIEGGIKIPPIKNAKNTVEKLKNSGFKLSLVTGRNHKLTSLHMKEAGFDLNSFDVIVTCEETKNHKPDPEPILYAYKLLKVEPEDVIYVGDSLLDYQSAKKSGVEFFAVLTGDIDKKEFRENGIKNIISSISELPKFLKL